MSERIYKKWTKKEEQEFLSLLKNYCVADAAKIHAHNTGRPTKSAENWYYRQYRKNTISSAPKKNLNPWTEEETKELLKLIEKHPENNQEAFRIFSRKNGKRSVKAAEQHFQAYRKKEEAKVCFGIIGKKSLVSSNRKNIYAGTGGDTIPMKPSKWKRILSILFE